MTPEIRKLFDQEEKYEEMKLGQNWENMLRKSLKDDKVCIYKPIFIQAKQS